MKQAIDNSTKGISDLISTILMVILVIGLAAVITAFLMPGFIQKSVYIASEVKAIPIVNPYSNKPIEVIGLLSKDGEPFHIIGQKQPYMAGAPVSVHVLSPDGVNHTWSTIDISAGSLYGKQIYIYPPNFTDPSRCDLCMTDYPPPSSQKLATMDKGRWTIQFVDEDAHILVMSNTDGVISDGGTTSRPNAGNYPENLYNNHCQPLSILSSNLGSYKVNPNMSNMKYQTFNGNQYAFVEYPSSPELNFNGDLAISLWYNPTTNLSYTGPNGVGWHQLIGKGQTISPGTRPENENDNYQVMQLGDRLLFEWNDATTGEHYQAITPPTILANQWNYLTVTVQGGILNIYNNDVSLPLVLNNNNVPPANPIPLVPAPVNGVNLMANDNNMYIGNQYQSNYQYAYIGDIGSVALYNRGLTPDEIQNNYNYFNA